MATTFIIRPTWPLGCRFIDSKGRTFEVIKVIMGYPDLSIGYEVETNDGWIVSSELGEHPQSRAGFVDIADREKLIIESIDKLEQFVANGHLRRL